MWYVQLLHAFLHRSAINEHQLLSNRRTKALPVYRYPKVGPEPSTRKDYPLSKMVPKNHEQENPSNMSGPVRVAGDSPLPTELLQLPLANLVTNSVRNSERRSIRGVVVDKFTVGVHKIEHDRAVVERAKNKAGQG